MKVPNKILTTRSAALLSGVFLIATGSAASAADQPELGWYSSGAFEVGARIFSQRPPSGYGKTATNPFWLTPTTSDSRAKFEEYGKVPSGLFLESFSLNAGSRDGRFGFDFSANNVGFDNQSYYLNLSEYGRQYLTLGWDQTPHLLSTSAKSVFGGVGSNRLTVDAATRTYLQSQMGFSAGAISNTSTTTGSQSQTQRNNIDNYINNTAPMSNIELKTQRDKFIAVYRATPNDAWDIKVGYSHEHRTGVRPLGIGYGYAMNTGFKGGTIGLPGSGTAATTVTSAPRPSSGSVEVPQPIDDRTQDINASGQYVGSTPWGGKWTGAVKYAGSLYDNSIKSFDIDNPFCITCIPYNGVAIAGNIAVGPNMFRYSLPPSNNAHGVTANFATDIPVFKSRYVGTFQYTTYRQNDPFIDSATNGVTTLAALPAASLNGQIDGLLANNVLTSHLTRDVTNVARVRFFEHRDRTQPLALTNYMYGDGGTATSAPLTRLRESSTKLNMSDTLKWHANKWLTVSGEYFYERHNITNSEVDHLTEHGAKFTTDITLMKGVTSHSSYSIAKRRYGMYEDTGNVITRPMRLFMIANRDRQVGNSFIEIPVLKNLSFTPNGGFRLDDYPDGVANRFGTTKDRAWNLGAGLGARLGPDALLSFSYNYEQNERHMESCCGTTGVAPEANLSGYTWKSDITQRFNTYIAALDWKAIPNKLDFRFEYLAAKSSEANNTTPCSVGLDACTGGGTGVITTQFPDETNLFQRFSAIARYFVDPAVVQRMGWKGEVVAKLRYTWERNQNTNWATDTYTPYAPAPDQTTDITSAGRSLFMAYNNPNYTTQYVVGSIAFKW